MADVIAILFYGRCCCHTLLFGRFFASVSYNYIIGWCYCHVADVITTWYCVIVKWWQMLLPCGRWKGHLLGLWSLCYCPVTDGMATAGWRLPWVSHVVNRQKLDYWDKISSDLNSSCSHISCRVVNMYIVETIINEWPTVEDRKSEADNIYTMSEFICIWCRNVLWQKNWKCLIRHVQMVWNYIIFHKSWTT